MIVHVIVQKLKGLYGLILLANKSYIANKILHFEVHTHKNLTQISHIGQSHTLVLYQWKIGKKQEKQHTQETKQTTHTRHNTHKKQNKQHKIYQFYIGKCKPVYNFIHKQANLFIAEPP
jgi:hypothetical protein